MAMEKLRPLEAVAELPYIYIDPKSLEEKMPESDAHSNLLQYLAPLLKWLYRSESWYISSNLQIIQPLPDNGKRDITPDIAVFKGVQLPVANRRLESWQMALENRPAPSVAIEIASKSTWHDDVGDKVSEYGGLGVKEYFAYDPNIPAYWAKHRPRLLGWYYQNKVAIPMEYNESGWLWSEELQTFLVPDGRLLRLYTRDGKKRLTEAQKARLARKRERLARKREHQARLEAERAKQEVEQRLADALEKLRRLEQQDLE